MNTVVAENVADHVRKSFDFTIDKLPLSGPDNMKTPVYGLFRSDTAEFVGRPVAKDYVPHQSDDVMALVEAAGHAFDGICNVSCGFNDGHHVIMQPTKEFRLSVFGTADNVFPRIMINASYDGRAFRAMLGFWRDACKNMSRLRKVDTTTVAIRHSRNLRPRMDELINTFGQLKESWVDLTTVIAELQNRQVRITDFLNEVYGPPGDTKRGLTVHKNRTEAIFRRLMDERFRTGRDPIGEDFEVSAWEAYNAVQGFTQHEATRHGNVDSFNRIMMAMDSAAVVKAESLAMATLAA